MSIGGNLNMALLSNDFAISASAGAAGTTGKAAAGLTGESPFQKMIARVLEKDGTTSVTQNADQAVALSDTAGTASEGEESIGEMIAALLFGNAGQNKMKLQNQAETSTDESALSILTQDDTGEDDQTPDSLASLLAMFDGTFSAKLITTDDGTATTESELTAADLVELIESVQPGKNGISGLLNRREQLTDLVKTDGENEKTDLVNLLGQTTDENGKLTVLAEIGGKQIEFTGYLNGNNTESVSTAAVTDSSDEMTVTASTDQGITLEELSALLSHTGEKASSAGLGRLSSGQERMRADQQETGFAHQMQGKTAVSSDDSSATAETTDTSDLQMETTTQSSSSDSSSEIADANIAAAYQTHMRPAADTTAVAQTNPQTGSTEAYSQVSDQIMTTLEKKGPSEFKMQLQPENLGQIDISLKISAGKLIIDIAADKAQTQTMLIGQVDKLISSLGLQNVQVESVQVTQQMNSDTQNQSYQHQNSGMNFANGRQDSGEAGQSWQQFTGGIFGSQPEATSDDALETAELMRTGFGRMNYRI